MGIGTAIAISGALAAGASIAGSEKSATATRRGSRTQAQAADRATEAQLDMYYQGRDDLAPWREAGANALQSLYGTKTYGLPDPGDAPERDDFKAEEAYENALDAYNVDKKAYDESVTYEGGLIQQGPGEFVPEEQPGYEFGFNEFIKKPHEQAGAAAGQRLSGQGMRDLTRYAQDYASTGYDNFLNRYYASLNPYQNVAAAGQSAAAGTAQLAAQTGQGVAQTGMAAGAAQAGGIVGQANAYNQGLAGVAGAGQNALQSYMDMKVLEKIGGSGNVLDRGSFGAPVGVPYNQPGSYGAPDYVYAGNPSGQSSGAPDYGYLNPQGQSFGATG